MQKAHHSRSTFGSSDVEKAYPKKLTCWVGASGFVDIFLENTKTASTKSKTQHLNRNFCGLQKPNHGTIRRFYKNQIMVKNLVQIHPQKSSQKKCILQRNFCLGPKCHQKQWVLQRLPCFSVTAFSRICCHHSSCSLLIIVSKGVRWFITL